MPKASSFSAKHWGREVQRGFDFYFASGRADLVVPKAADIKEYFTSQAPRELKLDQSVPLDQSAVKRFQFSPSATLASEQAVAISHLSIIDLGSNLGPSLVFTDMRGGSVCALKLADVPSGTPIQLAKLQNPCRVHACKLEDTSEPGLLIADLGSFLPADHQAGRVVWLRPTGRTDQPYETEVLLTGRGRVADAAAHDLDNDGDLDILVSDFGWHETGQLLWLERVAPGPAKAGAFVPHILDDVPGTLETNVLDLNQDGRLDIVALVAQDQEVLMAYIRNDQGGYDMQALFSANDPAYGSSGMQWLDLDRDGDQDCLLTNGDSFDSFEVKPYHAIHWLENRGKLDFRPHEIMRLPGVHEAIGCDLDGDADLDILAAAFLPRDLRSALSDQPVGIVWLENDGQQNFRPRPLQVGTCSHPAICAGDFNRDGQIDIAVANFYEDTAELKPAIEFLLQ